MTRDSFRYSRLVWGLGFVAVLVVSAVAAAAERAVALAFVYPLLYGAAFAVHRWVTALRVRAYLERVL